MLHGGTEGARGAVYSGVGSSDEAMKSVGGVRMGARRAALVSVAATALSARVALGQGAVSAAQTQEIVSQAAVAPDEEESLVRQAIELRRGGRHEAAVPLLRRAYELRRSPRACGQLALAEQAIGRWAPAEALLRESLSAVGDAWVERNRATLEASLAAAGRRLATVEVVGGDDGAELWVDGERAGILQANRILRVVAGTARVEHRSRGRSVARVLELAPGGRERVYFAPTAAEVTAAQRPVEPSGTVVQPAQPAQRFAPSTAARSPRLLIERGAHPATWVGVTMTGVAAMTVVTAWGAGQSIAGAYEAQCPGASSPDRDACANRLREDQRTLDVIGTVTDVGWALLAAGAVTTGVGVGLSIAGRGVAVHGRF
jgi:hypothetical protein